MTELLSAAEAAEPLRDLLPGRLFLPDDDGYDTARSPWNLAADLSPAAVAVPVSVEEVQRVVRAAAAAGLRVAPISTGHAAMPLSSRDLSRTVLLRLSSLTGVTIDPKARTAHVIGGTMWKDVVAAASAHGLTGLHGSAGDVAVAGFVLNGGISFYGRRHGIAANSVRAIDVVTAEGELHRVDADHDPELFWALRGGGGNFGVITAIELDLVPYADVVAGMMLWDRSRAAAVLPVWRTLTADAPESVTMSFRILSFPPVPDLPPFLSGRDLVVVDGAILESDDEASAFLAPLRELRPEIDSFDRIPASELPLMHMDPPQPTPAVSDSLVLGGMPDEAIDAYLGFVGDGTRSGLMIAELRQLGGAFARRPASGGVVSGIDGAYGLYALAVAPTQDAEARGLQASMELVDRLRPWEQPDTCLLTFAERPMNGEDAYGSDCRRLRSIAERVDPEGMFQAGHGIR